MSALNPSSTDITNAKKIPLIIDDNLFAFDSGIHKGQVFFDYCYESLVKRLIERIYIYQSQFCPFSQLTIQAVLPYDILKIKVEDFDFFAKSICEFLHIKLGKQVVFITKYIQDALPITTEILDGLVNLCTTYQNQKSLLKFKYIKQNIDIHFVSGIFRAAYNERAEGLFNFFVETVETSTYPDNIKENLVELIANCLNNYP